MELLPASPSTEGRLLVLGAAEIETVLLSVALARGLERKIGRLFASVFDLGNLVEIPAFRQGKAPTILLDFPTPELARQPEEVRRALRMAVDLTWVSRHPIDDDEIEQLQGARSVASDDFGSRWDAMATNLDCPLDAMEGLEKILDEPPSPLPEAEDADLHLAWHYASLAARADPMYLGAVTRHLIELEAPEADLVHEGRALVQERRALDAESSFHSFPTPMGQGVLIMAPRAAMGFYRDLAAEVRASRGCTVSVLAFDSQEPVIVELSARDDRFERLLEAIATSLDEHVVRGFGASGFAVKGNETGSLDVLEKLVGLLSQGVD